MAFAMDWEVQPQVEATLGLIGTLAAILLFVAPLKTFRRIAASRSVEDFSAFPYVSALLNCSTWVLYALPFVTPQRTSPLVTNALGMVFQLAYLAVYIRHAAGRPRAAVLRTRSVEFMPLQLSLNGFICSSVWSLYGVYVRDIFVVLPNLFGTVLGIVQLVIYYIIRGIADTGEPGGGSLPKSQISI
eukprot:jgi/Mesen1/5366/ME000268S04565